MTLDREQFCSECGDPTGRAGNFHESLFARLPNGKELGPLCDSCAGELSLDDKVEIIYR